MAMSPMGGSSKRSSRYNTITEINITPFVDVMLVLLVVFMITAPMLTQGVQVSLPEVENTEMKVKEDPIEIAIKKDGAIFVGSAKVKENELVTKLKAIKQVRQNAAILLRADKEVPYGAVMTVMSSLQTSGLVDVGMVTEPRQ
ncbi:MAG: Biopolymer transport protein ExbD [Proteobacteria bacterium]|nr:MAG: Biopolymer transport protein ExbD [Pseudomonadota bacterium]